MEGGALAEESWVGNIWARWVKVGIGIVQSVPICGRYERWLERVG